MKFITYPNNLFIRYNWFRRHMFSVLIILPFLAHAQQDTIKYDVSAFGIISSGSHSPFWLYSRQYGINSESPQSAGVLFGFQKSLTHKNQLFDHGYKANLLLETDNNTTQAYFHEVYFNARFSVFDLIVGAREEILGNQDSTLSCGGFLFSQNSKPMPKITLGIEHFTPVPFTSGFLEIRGALSHGWFTDNNYTTGLLLHHKYLYARVGGKLPVHFQYGLDHVAQWGGNVPDPLYGQQPTSFSDYIKVFLVRSGGTGGEAINKLGNHIISQSMRLDVDLSDYKVSGYWQNISEDGPVKIIGATMNATDGLWGVSIRNKKFPYVKGIVYEYLNTTDQSGPYHDKDGVIYGGGDTYFSNYVYQNGWSYFGKTIGIPFILPSIKDNSMPYYYKSFNNRVQVHHIGIEGDIFGFNYKAMSSFSKNYGTYSLPFHTMIQNTSLFLEVNKQFPHLSNIELGCKIGADFGKLYGNSVGFMISIKKTGELFHY